MSNLPALASASSVAGIMEWGDFAKKSGIVPPNVTKEQAAAIVQTGHEIGLAPLQSLRSMNFIKGRLTMAVQLQLALARSRGVIVKNLDDKPGVSCSVTLKRDAEEITCAYTMDDAKKAGLTSNDTYAKYGRQMLRWRAIGDALRIIAPDLVMGLLDPMEVESIEAPAPAVAVAEVVDATPAPLPIPEAAALDALSEPLPPPKAKGKNYAFLQTMGAMKTTLGETRYYEMLGAAGYEHANDITERKAQLDIYAAMKAEVDEKAAQEAHSNA